MIQNYEQGKRFILAHASCSFERVVRGGSIVTTWSINGTVWVEHDAAGDYRLQDTGVSVLEYAQ